MCRDANESVTQCKNTECDKKFRLLAVPFWKVERAREIAERNWRKKEKRLQKGTASSLQKVMCSRNTRDFGARTEIDTVYM